LHPRLTRRAAWLEYDGDLPVLEGTLIRLVVDRLPGDGDPKPLWLWSSRVGASASDVDRLWQAFLRRFDLEHTFRFFKQTLGWTAPKLRDPHAADRWTWIVIAAYTQLRLARHLAQDLRRPWERPAPAGRLTPARVRRGFRNLRAKTARPAGAPRDIRQMMACACATRQATMATARATSTSKPCDLRKCPAFRTQRGDVDQWARTSTRPLSRARAWTRPAGAAPPNTQLTRLLPPVARSAGPTGRWAPSRGPMSVRATGAPAGAPHRSPSSGGCPRRRTSAP
jgi:hypothetical protein